MAELDKRLAAQTAETERLKVCEHFTLVFIQHLTSLKVFILLIICIHHHIQHLHPPRVIVSSLCLPSSSLVQEEAKSSSETRTDLEQQLASATSTVAILQTEKSKLQTEVQESKKEQDDLLMLLADQDQKIHSLKLRLKDLGETVDKEFIKSFNF